MTDSPKDIKPMTAEEYARVIIEKTLHNVSREGAIAYWLKYAIEEVEQAAYERGRQDTIDDMRILCKYPDKAFIEGFKKARDMAAEKMDACGSAAGCCSDSIRAMQPPTETLPDEKERI